MNSKQQTEIEVESKFAILQDVELLEQKLISEGAERLTLQKFTDQYFDIASKPSVTLKDFWLRYRAYEIDGKIVGKWQLKKPVGSKSKGSSNTNKKSAVYEEVEGVDAVQQTILAANSSSTLSESESLHIGNADQFLAKYGFESFATFSTSRSSWKVKVDNDKVNNVLTVDLDGTDFGHQVGEVEAIVYDANHIASAENEINVLLEKLGVGGTRTNKQVKAVGKLELFLQRRAPDHYKACVENGIL